MRILKTVLMSAALLGASFQVMAAERVNDVVLVHGAYADGSGWKGVFQQLKSKGYNIYVAQLPETTLKEDVDTVNRLIKYINKDVILVGHSYGGIVVTEAGMNDLVKGLVYVAAVVPDADESIPSLRTRFKAPADDVVQLGDGFRMLNPKTFHADFAADVPKDVAEFMAYSQTPIAAPNALGAKVSHASWKNKPSWYLIPKNDRKINPDLLRFMAQRAGSKTIETAGSHAIFISKPKVVADLIIDAANNANK